MAVDDLSAAHSRWGSAVAELITNRHRFDDFESAFAHHGQDEIKVVIEWTQAK